MLRRPDAAASFRTVCKNFAATADIARAAGDVSRRYHLGSSPRIARGELPKELLPTNMRTHEPSG
jgi:hypothetical protein